MKQAFQHSRKRKAALALLAILIATGAVFLMTPKDSRREPHNHRMAGLVNQQGMAVDMQDYQGKFLLVYFGYSQCRRDCPQALALLSDVVQSLGREAREVQPLFISLDTQGDTPARLKRFMQPFHPGIETLTFRDRAAMLSMCETFELFTAETLINGEAAAISSHEPAFFLLDRSGDILDRFDYPVAPEEIIGAINDHRQEGGISI